MALAHAVWIAVVGRERHGRESLRLLAYLAVALARVALDDTRLRKLRITVLNESLHHVPLRAIAANICGNVAKVVVVVRHAVIRAHLEAVQRHGRARLDRDKDSVQPGSCHKAQAVRNVLHKLRVKRHERIGDAVLAIRLNLVRIPEETLQSGNGAEVDQQQLAAALVEAPVLRVGDAMRRLRSDVLLETLRRRAVEAHYHVVCVDFLAMLVAENDAAASYDGALGVHLATQQVVWRRNFTQRVEYLALGKRAKSTVWIVLLAGQQHRELAISLVKTRLAYAHFAIEAER